jgi:hypothetical protein
MWLLNTGDRSIEVTAWTGLTNLKKSDNIRLPCLKNIKPKITGTFCLFSYWKQIFVDPFPLTIWLLLFQPQQTVHLICIIESYTRNNSHNLYFINSWLHVFVSYVGIFKQHNSNKKNLNTNKIQRITKIISKKSLKIPKGNQNRKSQKDRQHNDQRKRTNIDLKAIHIKLFKDRVTRTPLKTGSELMCPRRVKQ